MISESQLEQLCLGWFADNGWEISHGPDIAPDGDAPERQDYRQVLLLGDLDVAVRRLNPQLPEDAVEQVLAQVAHPGSLDLVVNNRAFQRLLLEGVPVTYKCDDRQVHDHAFLIDFARVDANRFRIINQFTIAGGKQLRRPDLLAFINGLPLAVLELKSPTDEKVDIWDAFHQVQTYKEEVPELFVTNEALVVSDGYNARLGSLTASQERFMPWRTIKHEDDKRCWSGSSRLW